VDARQWGQPGGVSLASDRRVGELVRLGDAAVPALLDALETDVRLTRSVHLWRDYSPSRTVLSVREASLTALMSILRVRFFKPDSTSDNFTGRGDAGAREMAKRLRAYWKEYGHLPFDRRMMKVLTDPGTSFEAKREASGNLAALTRARQLQTTIDLPQLRGDPPDKPSQAAAQFSKPTVAEAILAAMDADLKAHDSRPREDSTDDERRRIEDAYLVSLVELGDRRIAGELARRAAAAMPPRMRRLWARAANDLGEPGPLRAFFEDFRVGKIKLPAKGSGWELYGILSALVAAATPEADRALDALTDPKHPQHKPVARRLLNLRVGDPGVMTWFAHPYCLRILRTALDDTTPTGGTYVLEEGGLSLRTSNAVFGLDMPGFLADQTARRGQAQQRVCDAAADRLGVLVIGLPCYHALLNGADKRLKEFKAAYDHFGGNYRRARWPEIQLLGLDPWTPSYIPDVRPLGRGATAEDVKVGKAVFHFDGMGKPTDLQLPAAAELKGKEKKKPPRGLIVQVDIGPDGELTCGILTRREVRAVPARDLMSIKTFAELENEQKEQAQRKKAKMVGR
jgi:hypothetical protein